MNKKYIKYFMIMSLLFIFSGCTHSIVIDPPIATNAYGEKLPLSVGIYIDKNTSSIEVTDTHPGGDMIKFSKTSTLINSTLENLDYVFSDVELIDSLLVSKESRFNILIKPEMTELKGTKWSFTQLPPTTATSIIKYTIYDKKGKIIWTGTGTGFGHSGYSRLDIHLSRAYENAVQKAMEDIIQQIRSSQIRVLLLTSK